MNSNAFAIAGSVPEELEQHSEEVLGRVVGHEVERKGFLPVGKETRLIVAMFAVAACDLRILPRHVGVTSYAADFSFQDGLVIHLDGLFHQVGNLGLAAAMLRHQQRVVDYDVAARARAAPRPAWVRAFR